MSNIDEHSTNEELVEKEELQSPEVTEETVKEEVQPSETPEPSVEKEQYTSCFSAILLLSLLFVMDL